MKTDRCTHWVLGSRELNRFVEAQQPLDPEVDGILRKTLWELYDDLPIKPACENE